MGQKGAKAGKTGLVPQRCGSCGTEGEEAWRILFLLLRSRHGVKSPPGKAAVGLQLKLFPA